MTELTADIAVRRGSFELSVRHSFPSGQLTAIIGPNGAGKTTLIETVAGLLQPEKGIVRAGEVTLSERRGAQNKQVPPYLRGMALLAQEPRLFPHMTVEKNIGFGSQAKGKSKKETRETVRRWVERLKLEEYLHRYPDQLSGGQQQRVSLARALAADPKILLLDEPTAELDVTAARTFRRVLVEQLDRHQITTLMVTHCVEDVVELADQLVVLDGGSVIDNGPASEHLTFPRCDFVAEFVGVNRVLGTVAGDRIVFADGLTLQGVAANRKALPATENIGWAVIEPANVSVGNSAPAGTSGQSRWQAEVIDCWAHHGGYRVQVSSPPNLVAHLSLTQWQSRPLTIGQAVTLNVPSGDVQLCW